jgi:hypothetical protein
MAPSGRKLVGAILFTVFSSLSLARSAEACTCLLPIVKRHGQYVRLTLSQETKGHFRDADIVFLGTVEDVTPKITTITQKDGLPYTITDYSVRFVVKERFKGALGATFTSENGSGTGDCSWGSMQSGKDYLVFAFALPQTSSGSIGTCSGTRSFSRETNSDEDKKRDVEELRILRKLKR